MRPIVVVLAGALAWGCVAANPAPGTTPYREVATTEDGSIIRTNPDLAIRSSLNLPMDEAYAAMLVGYSHLGIQATTNDTAHHTLGNMSMTVTGEFLHQNLSRYFECGRDAAFSTPRADHYRITFSVVSTLAPAGTSATNVQTLVTAKGADPSGNGADVYCSTTGRLESELLRAARS